MERAEYLKLYELEDSYWWFVGRRQLVATLIDRWASPDMLGPILDVGCGTGANLAFLTRWGCETGTDLSPLALEFARRRGLSRLTQACGMSLPHPSHTFGLVTAFDLLYHRWVTNDARIVSECYRILRPGGWLLVMDSASPLLWSRHDELFYARQRYTLAAMRRMVAEGGFRICMLSYTNALLFPVALAVRWLNRLFPSLSDAEMRPLPSWLNQALIRVLSLEAIWLERGSFPIGSSLVCLAQKPEE